MNPLITLSIPYAGLMVAKLVRVTQEAYAKKSGYISFGGDDHYQQANTHTDIHDALVISKLQFKMHNLRIPTMLITDSYRC